MRTPVKVLYLEDDEIDKRGFLRMIREKKLPYELTLVSTLAEARAKLAQCCFDVIVADYHLPDGDCSELFNEVPDTPFILITGTLDEQLALRTLQRGADDYLPKDTQQRYLGVLPFVLEKTLHRQHLRDAERRLARQLREKEEQLHLITDNAPALIAYIDRDLRYRFVNQQYEKWFGVSSAEILGKTVADLFGKTVAAKLRPRIEKALAGEPVSYEDEIPFRLAGTRWVQGHYVPHRDPDGKVLGFYVLVVDATARKQAEQTLRATEERFRGFMENSPAIAWAKDEDGRHVYLNRAYQLHFGVHFEDWKGKTDFELWPEEVARQFRENDLRVLQTGEPAEMMEETISASGEHTYWWSVKFPFQDASKKKYVGGIGLDITARKKAEDALVQSEKKFRAVFEQAAVGMGHVSLSDARWIDVNDAFCKMLGYTREEMRATSWLEITHPEDLDRDLIPFRKLAAGELDTYSVEKRFIHKSGHHVWARLTLSLVRDLQGKPDYELAIIENITEQKGAEKLLRKSEQEFRALAESVPQLVWTTDSEGRVEYLNEAWHGYTGQTQQEAYGTGWAAAIHPDDRARVIERWTISTSTGRIYETEYRLRRRDGQYRWFLARGVPMREPQGRIERWFGTCTDIDEQRRMLEALRESERRLSEAKDELAHVNEDLERKVLERTAKLQESVAELEHFSYTITHDMRAPLRAMKGFAQILMEESAVNMDESQKEHISRIISSATRMDNLIRDALNYSKLVRRELPLSPVNAESLLREIIDSYPEFSRDFIDIHIESPLLSVRGNRAALTQCFSNLINNAIKFSKPGEKPQLTIRSEEHGDYVRLFFEDNGIGIPREYNHRVFEMFTQLHQGYTGTGIGLALVRKAAERMDGSVGVESQEGVGTRFWVQLHKAPSNELEESPHYEPVEA